MRWLFRRGESDDAPRILTLQDTDASGADAGSDSTEQSRAVRFLPGGDLAINVGTPIEAREALLELQRKQRELLAGRARGVVPGIAGVGNRVGRGVSSGAG